MLHTAGRPGKTTRKTITEYGLGWRNSKLTWSACSGWATPGWIEGVKWEEGVSYLEAPYLRSLVSSFLVSLIFFLFFGGEGCMRMANVAPHVARIIG